MATSEHRDGIDLTNLDEPLSPDAGTTKRDLVDYLDAVADRMLPGLVDRPLTVLRVLRGRAPFMQKNVPKYTPEWVRTVSMWAEASHREVHYALCNDRRTLLWLANQRAVEYHPTLGLAGNIYRPTHLVLDLDPPDDDFAKVVAVAHLVRQALSDNGLTGAVKTSGAKGVHIFVPIDDSAPVDDVAAATRALAARAEATRPKHRDDGVHRPGPRRQGVRRCDARRWGHGRGGVQPTPAAGHSGVLPGRLVRTRFDFARRLHGAHGHYRTRGPPGVDGVDATGAAIARRTDRVRPHHSRRPGGGDARRKAASTRPPRIVVVRGPTTARVETAPRPLAAWGPGMSRSRRGRDAPIPG